MYLSAMVKFSQMQGILCGGSLSLARALSHSTLLRSSVGALNILVLGLEMTSICLIKAGKVLRLACNHFSEIVSEKMEGDG